MLFEQDATEGEKDSAKDETSSPVPFSNKLLAFRALGIGLKFSYHNWRMWANYMIVALDVGEFAEACRAQARVVEERSEKVGAAAVDEDLLDRLVDAATRSSSTANEVASLETNKSSADAAGRSPKEPYGLPARVLDLLEKTILPRVSSQRIFRSYARLLSSLGRWSEVVQAYLSAYRLSFASTMEKGAEPDESKWHEAVSEVEETVDMLRNFGPRAEAETTGRQDAQSEGGDGQLQVSSEAGAGRWKMQARSIVRTFMARHKDAFEDDPFWERLTQLLEELKK